MEIRISTASKLCRGSKIIRLIKPSVNSPKTIVRSFEVFAGILYVHRNQI